MKLRQEILGKVKRLVIKLGTGLLTDERKRLSPERIAALAAQVAALHRQGRQCVLVSSGAIAAGMGVLGFEKRPRLLSELQAAAAVGQGKLMAFYDEAFGRIGRHVAQVLLTHEDLQARARHLNARRTLETLLARGVIPIINENDTVAVEEIKFGDNDRLGALAATLIDADLLIILSHVAGLLDRDRRVIGVVPAITRDIEALAGGTDRATSVGGMTSKLAAGKIVARAGVPMLIADGGRPGVLAELLAGEPLGTLFLPRGGRLEDRKRWIAFFKKPTGVLVIDDGARRALRDGGKSLLAPGIVRREGSVAPGGVVSIHDLAGVELARGLLRATTGVVVHRDDLVIL